MGSNLESSHRFNRRELLQCTVSAAGLAAGSLLLISSETKKQAELAAVRKSLQAQTKQAVPDDDPRLQATEAFEDEKARPQETLGIMTATASIILGAGVLLNK